MAAAVNVVKTINVPIITIIGMVGHVILFFSVHKVADSPAGSVITVMAFLLPPILALGGTVLSIAQLAMGCRQVSAAIGVVLNILWLVLSLLLIFVIKLVLSAF